MKPLCLALLGASDSLKEKVEMLQKLGLWWGGEERWLEIATSLPNTLPKLESDSWNYLPFPEGISQPHPQERDKGKQSVTKGPPQGRILRMATGTAWPCVSTLNGCYIGGFAGLSSKGRKQIIRWLKKTFLLFRFYLGLYQKKWETKTNKK